MNNHLFLVKILKKWMNNTVYLKICTLCSALQTVNPKSNVNRVFHCFYSVICHLSNFLVNFVVKCCSQNFLEKLQKDFSNWPKLIITWSSLCYWYCKLYCIVSEAARERRRVDSEVMQLRLWTQDALVLRVVGVRSPAAGVEAAPQDAPLPLTSQL